VYMQNNLGHYYTWSLVNPHNWAIQILSQYGIIIFVMFATWLIWTFVFFCKQVIIINRSSIKFNYIIFGLMTIVGYVIISNSGSSFMSNTLNWLMLTVVAICSDTSEE